MASKSRRTPWRNLWTRSARPDATGFAEPPPERREGPVDPVVHPLAIEAEFVRELRDPMPGDEAHEEVLSLLGKPRELLPNDPAHVPGVCVNFGVTRPTAPLRSARVGVQQCLPPPLSAAPIDGDGLGSTSNVRPRQGGR